MNAYRSFAANRVLGFFSLLLAGVFAGQVVAQPTVVRGRDFPVNGRNVQEIRMGNEPGSRTRVRILVVTNGPTSGTTSLYTAVSDINDLARSEAPEPVFTPVIESGTVFSVGGGCQRGNQLDFPFINANQPLVLRFVGGSSSIVPVGVGTETWDSADCTVSNDGTRTFFVFTARTLQRGFFFVDAGGPNDLQAPQVSLGQVKTPFAGGLRPAISTVPGTARKVTLLFMNPNGQTRWWQYDPDPINVDFNCLVGTQTPPPSAFTIPRGAKVINRDAIADLDGDGDFEVVRMTPGTSPNCTKTPTPTTVGPVAGIGFPWSEPASVEVREFNQRAFLAGFLSITHASSDPMVSPGPHAAAAGSFAACLANNTEVPNGIVSLTAYEAGRLSAIHSKLGLPPPDPTSPLIFRSGVEDSEFILLAFCINLGS